MTLAKIGRRRSTHQLTCILESVNNALFRQPAEETTHGRVVDRFGGTDFGTTIKQDFLNVGSRNRKIVLNTIIKSAFKNVTSNGIRRKIITPELVINRTILWFFGLSDKHPKFVTIDVAVDTFAVLET